MPRKNIIGPIVFLIEDFTPEKGSHLSIAVDLLELLSVIAILVIEGDNIEGTSPLVLFAGLVDVPPDDDPLVLPLFFVFHLLESLLLPGQLFFAEVGDDFLLSFELGLSHGLVGNVEVFVETLGLGDEVGRDWVGAEDLCGIDVLVEIADSLLETPLLDRFLVFHRRASRPSAGRDVVEFRACLDLGRSARFYLLHF